MPGLVNLSRIQMHHFCTGHVTPVKYNIIPFYGYSLHTADSSRAVVSYWRKDVHLVLVNRLGSLSRNRAVRLIDRLHITKVLTGT